MTHNSHSGTPLTSVDYNLHGLAGIRLLDATSKDVDTVTRQLGPIQAPFTSEPDITIRFVDSQNHWVLAVFLVVVLQTFPLVDQSCH